MALVGSNSIHPGVLPAPDPHPGVHGVGTLEARLALGRDGAEKARNVARRNADAAKPGNHDMGKVLADAALQREGLDRGGADVGGVLVVFEVAIDREAHIHGSGLHGVGAGNAFSGIGSDLTVDRDARGGTEEVMRGVCVE